MLSITPSEHLLRQARPTPREPELIALPGSQMARCSPFGHAPRFRVIAVARARFDRVCVPFPGPFLLSGLRPLPKPVLQGSLGPSATYVFAIFISVRVGPALGRQDEKDVPWTRGGVLEHVRGGPDGARLPPLLI